VHRLRFSIPLSASQNNLFQKRRGRQIMDETLVQPGSWFISGPEHATVPHLELLNCLYLSIAIIH